MTLHQRITDRDDELTIISPASTPERGIPIPPPADPIERHIWERGVAARKAAGLGTFVGDYD